MDIRPIKKEEDYEAALEEIARLMVAEIEPDTPEGDRLEVLSILVEAYEEENYPVPLPDPIETIHYYMESRGLSRADLEPFIGTRARVSEILNRKRPLTLRMIRNLQEGLGIPAEVLIQPYEHELPDEEISSYKLQWPVHIEIRTSIYSPYNVKSVVAAQSKSTPLLIPLEAQSWYEKQPGELEN
jgi:HTH-type transcriptional regulator/antitoxin HigA